jgi:hypothetical protein
LLAAGLQELMKAGIAQQGDGAASGHTVLSAAGQQGLGSFLMRQVNVSWALPTRGLEQLFPNTVH